MPTSPVPFVHPSQITLHSTQSPQEEKLCIYNPFPHDIIFKLDNPSPSLFTLSQTQGHINSSNKIYVDLICTAQAPNFDGVLQVRFFKCSRPRHGHRHAQEYLGFREVGLKVLTDPGERKKTSAEGELVSLSERGLSKPLIGSNLDSASTRSSSTNTEHRCCGRRFQVITSLVSAVILFLLGFITSQTNEVWFAANVGGVTTRTCAVVCYTFAGSVFVSLIYCEIHREIKLKAALSCVLLVRLLTLR